MDLPAGRTISDWLGLLAGASLVDQINDQMIKWAAAFLDEGLAGWEMPGRHAGFYLAWRELAARDYSGRFLGIEHFTRKIRDLPDSPEDAIALFLKRLGIPEQRWPDYQARQFAQLPGWVGFIRWRGERPHYPAQKKHAIDAVQYLAVRLFYEVELVQSFCRREWQIDGTLTALTSHWETHQDEYQQARWSDLSYGRSPYANHLYGMLGVSFISRSSWSLLLATSRRFLHPTSNLCSGGWTPCPRMNMALCG